MCCEETNQSGGTLPSDESRDDCLTEDPLRTLNESVKSLLKTLQRQNQRWKEVCGLVAFAPASGQLRTSVFKGREV